MKNIDKQNANNKGEISFWELMGVLGKNWFTICMIIAVILSMGIGYSFAIQKQGQITYKINELVIDDDWEYYPSKLVYTYISKLNTFVKGETGTACVSARLNDNLIDDGRTDYFLELTYASFITKSEAEEIARKIVVWHNKLIDDEVAKVKAEAEEKLSILYFEYEKAEKEYFSYLAEADVATASNLATTSTLKSVKDVSYEMWRDEKIKLQDLNDKIGNIEGFYISDFAILSTVNNTWKMNISFSLIFGFVISILLVLIKESYRSYKSNEKE